MATLQAPEVFWIGCSDSRVPGNVVASHDPGEMFVQRTVANDAHSTDMTLLSALYFAVEALCLRGLDRSIGPGHVQIDHSTQVAAR